MQTGLKHIKVQIFQIHCTLELNLYILKNNMAGNIYIYILRHIYVDIMQTPKFLNVQQNHNYF